MPSSTADMILVELERRRRRKRVNHLALETRHSGGAADPDADLVRSANTRPNEPETLLPFRAFIEAVNPRYIFYPHAERLITQLQRVADGELLRLMIFIPPRHSKSETVSRLFTAYYLYRYAARWVALASYGADLAYTLSRAARGNYQANGGTLDPAAYGVKHWQTPKGGGMWATGVGGPATGKGAHLAIVDDPVKDAEAAQSETIRRRTVDWWQSTWTTRLEPDAALIVLQTRWNEADLAGYLLEQESDEPDHWHILNMPAIAEEPRTDWPATVTLEPDPRPLGAALCPERYDTAKLSKIERRIGSYWFGALYQQHPRPRSGGMFSESPQIIEAMPIALVRSRIRYWDKAGSDSTDGDWTAGVLLAFLSDHRVTVEDVARFQLGPAERNARMIEVAALDRGRGRVIHYIEQPPGDGVEATKNIIRAMAGFAVYAHPVRGNKIERADGWAAQWQAGNILLLRGAWNKAYINEHRAFPYGANDDQVDASSGAYNIGASAPNVGSAATGGARTPPQRGLR